MIKAEKLYKNTDFSQEKFDKNICDSDWNRYLQKYKDVYRLKRGEDGIWYIVCKNGQIKPYSLCKGLLGAYLYLSPRKKGFLLSKILSFTDIIQDSYDGVSIKFPESKLKDVEDVLKIKKKKVLSEEHKAKLRERLKMARGYKNE